MLVRSGLVLLVLLAIFGALGCESGLEAYDNNMQAWHDRLDSTAHFPQVRYDEQGLPYFEESEAGTFAKTLHQLLADMEKIRPPREIAPEHDRLVEVYRESFQTMEQYLDAAAVYDLPTTKRLAKSLEGGREFQNAMAQLNRAIEAMR